MFRFDKDTFITLKINDSIFTGPFIRMWQTFRHKNNLLAYYNGHWYPVKLVTQQMDYEEIMLEFDTFNIIGNKDIELLQNNIPVSVSNLEIGTSYEVNKNKVDKILKYSSNMILKDIHIRESKNDWLYGFESSDTEYVTLSSGIIVHI